MEETESTQSIGKTQQTERKTIFILTTRSFQDHMLFNPRNCRPVEFRKDAYWYQHAFPQYFTDIIHFLDLSALQAQVESYILQQLSSRAHQLSSLEQEVEKAMRKHFKIYLKKKDKEEKKDKKQKYASSENARQEFARNLEQVLANTASKKDAITHNVKKEMQRIIEELKTKILKNILINKSEEKTDLILEKEINTRSYRYATYQEVEENIAIDVAIATTIATLLDVIPSWWFTLLKNKNKYCYLNYEDAYSCYMFMQQHAKWLLTKCEEAHRQSNKNAFSLHNLIYKYFDDKTDKTKEIGETKEDWYIIKCFGMRTDPDFGLTYIISLIKEIESYYPDTIALSFNILIHDYDIGRKLIHSSVQLNLQTEILQKIKKSFAEKDMERTLENQEKIMLSPRQLQNYYGKEKFLLSLNAIYKLPFKPIDHSPSDRYKALEYISHNQESLKKIQRIIVFKHNKGEVAELLKTGFIFLLKYFIFYKQAIFDMQYELIRATDNLTIAYSPKKIRFLIATAESILKMIPSAEKALRTYVPATNRESLYIIEEKKYLAKTKENTASLLAYVKSIRTDNFDTHQIITNINTVNPFFQS